MSVQDSVNDSSRRKTSASPHLEHKTHMSCEVVSSPEDLKTTIVRILGALAYLIVVCTLSLIVCSCYIFLWLPRITVQKAYYKETSVDKGGITQGGKRG